MNEGNCNSCQIVPYLVYYRTGNRRDENLDFNFSPRFFRQNSELKKTRGKITEDVLRTSFFDNYKKKFDLKIDYQQSRRFYSDYGIRNKAKSTSKYLLDKEHL